VLKRSVTPFALAALLGAVLAGSAPLIAQQPGAAKSEQSGSTMVHVEGCLFTESAINAPAPVVVSAGSTQTWILTDVRVISGSISQDEAAKTIYTLTKGDPDLLRSWNGKRVGVTGRVGSGSPRPNLEVVSIRDISGGCPTLLKVS
jgi:hypothetical protein